jgi:hypothetical protein
MVKSEANLEFEGAYLDYLNARPKDDQIVEKKDYSKWKLTLCTASGSDPVHLSVHLKNQTAQCPFT